MQTICRLAIRYYITTLGDAKLGAEIGYYGRYLKRSFYQEFLSHQKAFGRIAVAPSG